MKKKPRVIYAVEYDGEIYEDSVRLAREDAQWWESVYCGKVKSKVVKFVEAE